MMFCGHRCEEAHDLADEVFVYGGHDAKFARPTPHDTLMTAYFDGVDPTDAVFNLFCASITSPGFTNHGYYVFSFGSTEDTAGLKRLLSDPVKTIRLAVGGDAPA